MLIIPCPLESEPHNTYGHLANFIRLGPDLQVKHFLQEVSKKMQQRLQEKQGKKVWMSTCGLGVFWLHMRLDLTPKYYSFSAYRNA